MRKKWFTGIIGLLALVIVLVGACATPAPPSTTLEPVKIAFIGPLTGPISGDGINMAKGAQLAVVKANAEGGILGGREVQIIEYDDQGLSEQSASVAKKAIELDGVKAIIGVWGASELAAVKQVAKPALIPVASAPAGAIDAMDDWYPGWFHDGDNFPYNVRPMIMKMETTPGLSTIAIVYQDIEFCRQGADYLHSLWDAPGSKVQIVGEVWHPMGQGDVKLEYTKAVSYNPDAIFCAEFTPPAMIGAIKSLHEIGYKGEVFTPTPSARKMIIDTVGEAAEGLNIGCVLIEDPNVPANVDYCARYRQAYDDDDIYYVGMATFENAQIIMQGMDKAGTDSDAAKIDQTVRDMGYTLLNGVTLTLTPQGFARRGRTYLATVQDGKLTFVQYAPIAESDYALYLR